MKKVLVLLVVAALATAVQAADISSLFTNIDFDSGAVTNGATAGFKGFDAPCTEIIGWTNYPAGLLQDAGVEGPGAWWGPYETNAGFMKTGDAAYTMSTYTVQSGDVFTIGYVAKWWTWTGAAGEWTATLFYGDPANVIGTFKQSGLTGDWLAYSDATGIAATPASVGGTLGILMQSTGGGIAQIDEITVNVVPEPATMLLLGLGGLSLIRRKR